MTVEQCPKEALLQSYSAVSGAESLLSGHTEDVALRGLAKMDKTAAYHCSQGLGGWERDKNSDGWPSYSAVLSRTESGESEQQAVSLCLLFVKSLRTFLGLPQTYPGFLSICGLGASSEHPSSQSGHPTPRPAPRCLLHSLLHQHHLPIRQRMWQSGCPELLSPPSVALSRVQIAHFPTLRETH